MYLFLNIENKKEKMSQKNDDENSDESNMATNYENMSNDKLDALYMCYRIVEEMKARGVDFCKSKQYMSE